MKNNILRNSIILTICLFITYIVFYNFVSGLLTRFLSPSISLYLGMMIFTATALYIFSISVIDKKFNKLHVNILAVLYLGIVMVLSFFKTKSNFTGINLNPLSIINDFKVYFNHTLLLVVTNTLLYLPLGIYLKFKVKMSNLKLLIGFLLYILMIETIQYVSHRGIFDINDIILNTLGFFLGILCRDFFMKNSIKHFQMSHK